MFVLDLLVDLIPFQKKLANKSILWGNFDLSLFAQKTRALQEFISRPGVQCLPTRPHLVNWENRIHLIPWKVWTF